MSRRHLTHAEAETALRLGRSVEQWLGRRESPEGPIIRWLRIDREKSGQFRTTLVEAVDVGDDDCFDVYVFPALDLDRPDSSAHVTETAAAALAYATTVLGADASSFVNTGVIQDEYRQARSN